MTQLLFLRHASVPKFDRFLTIVSFLVALPVSAQTLYLYPTTVTAPRGSYQSVTAVVQGVNNKTVTWTTDGGTIVGTNPCVVNEPCTAALYTTVAGTYHLTATSNANGSVSATSTITITGSPTPVTTHPRLLITAAMLPGFPGKGNFEQHAVSSAAGASDLRIQCRQQRLVLVVQRWHRSSFGERGEQQGPGAGHDGGYPHDP